MNSIETKMETCSSIDDRSERKLDTDAQIKSLQPAPQKNSEQYLKDRDSCTNLLTTGQNMTKSLLWNICYHACVIFNMDKLTVF